MNNPLSKFRPSDINFSSEDLKQAREIVRKAKETDGLEENIKNIVIHIRLLACKYSLEVNDSYLIYRILENMSKEDSTDYQSIAEKVGKINEDMETASGSVKVPKTGNVMYKGLSYSLLHDHPDNFPLEQNGYPAVEITKEKAKLSYVILDWYHEEWPYNILEHSEHDDDLRTIHMPDTSLPISNKIFDTINTLAEENARVEKIQLCTHAGGTPYYHIYLKNNEKYDFLHVDAYDEERLIFGGGATKNDYVFEDYACAELTRELKKYLSELGTLTKA